MILNKNYNIMVQNKKQTDRSMSFLPSFFIFFFLVEPTIFGVQLHLGHCSLLHVAQKHNQANKIIT